MLKIFIGYDKAEIAAYQVCSYSIIKNAKQPVSITPLNIRHLPAFKNNDYKSSTEFAFTRFLVPHLSDYKGWSLFMDADMLVRSDISELFAHKDESCDVQVVQHSYKPVMDDKFLGAEQTNYKKKNWSSVMLFNNENCKDLTFNYVNKAAGLALHQFEWAGKIGNLPKSWNYLEGEEIVGSEYGDPDIVHFTRGGPYFDHYNTDGRFQKEWWDYWREANSVLDFKTVRDHV